MPETIQTAIDRALLAYDALALLGEELEDEWTYVNDLADAWRSRLTDVSATRGDESLAGEASAAVDRVIAEIGLIGDPHRAIDWLSTFPQVMLLALAEPP